MLLIGLTGGIGSGKSTAARIFAELGALVVDADVLSREVAAPGSDGFAAVIAAFGPEFATSSGELDRRRLGERVFADPAARATLNAIVHPRVAERFAAIVAAAPANAVIVHDVPLLAENGLARNYDLVVVVEAPWEQRLARLVGRGLSQAEAKTRAGSQASDEQRRAVADAVLRNDRSPEELANQVRRVWREHIAPMRTDGEAL